MKSLFAAVLVLALGFAATAAMARGGHHYGYMGGHYSGGHGSSHRGGQYVNARTGNHYTHHY